MRIYALLCVFLGGLGQGIVNPKLPELLEDHSSLAFDSGLSASLMYIGIFFSSFLYGKVADRGYTFRLIFLGMLAYALTLFGFTQVHSKLGIFLLRFFEGIAICSVYVSADVVLCRASQEKERGQWLSYYGVALALGLLCGPCILMLTEFLTGIKGSSSTNLSLTGLALFVALAAIPAWLLHLPKSQEEAGIPRLNRNSLFSASLYGFLEAGLVAVLAAIVTIHFQATVENVFVLLILSAAAGSIFWGIWIDRVSGARALTHIYGLLSTGLLLLFIKFLFAPAAFDIYAIVVLLGIVAGGIYPAAFTWMVEGISPAQYGYASGAFSRAYGLGSVLGPLAFGLSVEIIGPSGFLVLASALGFVGLASARNSRSSNL